MQFNDQKYKVIQQKLSGLLIIKDFIEDDVKITSKKMAYRMYNKEQKEREVLRKKMGTDVTAQCEYEKRFFITESQYDLLKKERQELQQLDRLCYHGQQEKSRIRTRIKKIQDCMGRPIACPPNDNVVGIGSNVSIVVFQEGELRGGEFELINSAVSNETPQNYIEKIQSLGYALYGKQEGDTFQADLGNNGTIAGWVVGVKNTRSYLYKEQTSNEFVTKKYMR